MSRKCIEELIRNSIAGTSYGNGDLIDGEYHAVFLTFRGMKGSRSTKTVKGKTHALMYKLITNSCLVPTRTLRSLIKASVAEFEVGPISGNDHAHLILIWNVSNPLFDHRSNAFKKLNLLAKESKLSTVNVGTQGLFIISDGKVTFNKDGLLSLKKMMRYTDKIEKTVLPPSIPSVKAVEAWDSVVEARMTVDIAEVTSTLNTMGFKGHFLRIQEVNEDLTLTLSASVNPLPYTSRDTVHEVFCAVNLRHEEEGEIVNISDLIELLDNKGTLFKYLSNLRKGISENNTDRIKGAMSALEKHYDNSGILEALYLYRNYEAVRPWKSTINHLYTHGEKYRGYTRSKGKNGRWLINMIATLNQKPNVSRVYPNRIPINNVYKGL